MIPIHEINGKQFMKARALLLPVVVLTNRTFRMPSASRAERDHTVEFDSSESPTACSCTCEAREHNTPCWAMARALDALTILGVHNIYVGRAAAEEPPPEPSTSADISCALRASVDERGEMALLRDSETPLAGMLLSVP